MQATRAGHALDRLHACHARSRRLCFHRCIAQIVCPWKCSRRAEPLLTARVTAASKLTRLEQVMFQRRSCVCHVLVDGRLGGIQPEIVRFWRPCVRGLLAGALLACGDLGPRPAVDDGASTNGVGDKHAPPAEQRGGRASSKLGCCTVWLRGLPSSGLGVAAADAEAATITINATCRLHVRLCLHQHLALFFLYIPARGRS